MSIDYPLYPVHRCVDSGSRCICFPSDVETRPLLFTKADDSWLKHIIYMQCIVQHTVCVTAAEEVFTQCLVLTVSQLCSEVLGDE